MHQLLPLPPVEADPGRVPAVRAIQGTAGQDTVQAGPGRVLAIRAIQYKGGTASRYMSSDVDPGSAMGSGSGSTLSQKSRRFPCYSTECRGDKVLQHGTSRG